MSSLAICLKLDSLYDADEMLLSTQYRDDIKWRLIIFLSLDYSQSRREGGRAAPGRWDPQEEFRPHLTSLPLPPPPFFPRGDQSGEHSQSVPSPALPSAWKSGKLTSEAAPSPQGDCVTVSVFVFWENIGIFSQQYWNVVAFWAVYYWREIFREIIITRIFFR